MRELLVRPSSSAELIDAQDDCRAVGEVDQRAVAHDGLALSVESLSAALGAALSDETRTRATTVAGAISTDAAALAANLPLDVVSRERPPVSS